MPNFNKLQYVSTVKLFTKKDPPGKKKILAKIRLIPLLPQKHVKMQKQTLSNQDTTVPKGKSIIGNVTQKFKFKITKLKSNQNCQILGWF